MATRAKAGQKAKRPYHSPRRQEQAKATRTAILDAAERLFLRDGYVPTSMAGIAKEAGVALKTVYLAFEIKSGLLRALWHRKLRAGREEVPVGEQEWFREVVEEPDPERALRLNARNSRVVKGRIAPLGDVILGAAAADPDAAALMRTIWKQFYENQLDVVEALDRRGGLRRGLDPERAADILWTLNHPHVYVLLLRDRAWSPEDYERWLGDITISELLEAPRRGRRKAAGP